jgi:hypothetical protein
MGEVRTVKGAPAGLRAYRIWHNRLTTANTIERGLVRQWCNGVTKRAMGYEHGGAATTISVSEATTLVGLFDREAARQGERFGFRLTDEHSDFGREWLGRYWSRLWSQFNPPDDLVSVDQVHTSDTFRLIGTRVYNETRYTATVVPVYSVAYEGKRGVSEFAYHWAGWQTGGGR